MNGETRKATALQKEIVWLSSIRLACEGRKTWQQRRSDPGIPVAATHTLAALVAFLFFSVVHAARQIDYLQPGAGLGGGGPGSRSMGYLFLCQLIRKAWHFGAEF